MTAPRARWRATGAVLAVLLGSGVLVMSPAAAQDATIVLGEDGPAAVPMELGGMHPMSDTRWTLRVGIADGLEPADLTMSFVDRRDLENGCLRPEHRMGDTSCGDGDGAGELSDQARLTVLVTATVPSDVPCPEEGREVVSGVLRGLDDRTVPLASVVPGGSSVCTIVRVQVPDLAENNLTMTDTVRWTTLVAAEQSFPDVEVLGVTEVAPPRPAPSPSPAAAAPVVVSDGAGGLASTGVDVALLGSLALLLLGVGLLLRRHGRAVPMDRRGSAADDAEVGAQGLHPGTVGPQVARADA